MGVSSYPIFAVQQYPAGSNFRRCLLKTLQNKIERLAIIATLCAIFAVAKLSSHMHNGCAFQASSPNKLPGRPFWGGPFFLCASGNSSWPLYLGLWLEVAADPLSDLATDQELPARKRLDEAAIMNEG